MKALVLAGIRRIEMINKPMPKLKNADDVLIQIKSVGICGSDIHYFTVGKIGSQVVEFPFAIGHECSGIVVKTGKAVTRLKSGDLVTIDPSIHCGICDQCLAGRPHTCRRNMFLGCPGQLDGCLCEYLVMPEFNCFPVNDSLNPTEAVLVEPLTIGVYGVELANTNFRNKTIGIFGAGPIGLSILMILESMPECRTFCYEPLEFRRRKAAELGATYTFNPLEKDAFEITSEVEPLLLDLVFDCSGQQKAIDDATKILNPGGKLILTGIPPEGKYTFDMDMMRRKEITIINVRRQNHCVEKSIKLIENGLPVEKMVTHHFRPEATQEAFEMVADYKDGVIKAMIDFF